MSIRSLIRTERALALAFALLLVPSLAFAGKDDDYNRAMAAMNSNNVYDAAKYFCAVANADPGYKDAKINCKIYGDQVVREEKRNDERFNNGTRAYNSGDFDTAEQELRNIKGGVHLAEAKDYLNRIPAARAAKRDEQSDAAMQAKFEQAVAAFQRNDFQGAQSQFQQITGKRQGDAQGYITKIKNYDAAMQEGDVLASAKNWNGALKSYSEAAGIKSDGPGDPRSKAANMQQQLANVNVPPNVTPPVTPHEQPPKPTVKETKQTVDTAKLMKEGEAAARKGDYATARQKFKTVITVEPGNSQAQQELAALPEPAPPPPTGGGEQAPATPTAGKEADVILAKGITQYYQGEYESAEVHLKDYCDLNGGKSALGYFYIAASKLTRYFLGGEKDSDKKLLNDAQAAFRLAKKSPGFKPPERFVSPKIMKVYEGA